MDNPRRLIDCVQESQHKDIVHCKSIVANHLAHIEIVQDGLISLSISVAQIKSCMEQSDIARKDYTSDAEADPCRKNVPNRQGGTAPASRCNTLHDPQALPYPPKLWCYARLYADVRRTIITSRDHTQEANHIPPLHHDTRDPYANTSQTTTGRRQTSTRATNVNVKPSCRPLPQTDSDFSQYVRRRTRRFFVLNRIAAYVRSKGPTITKVSIFCNQRRKTTVVRVNVEDDKYAELLLFTDFWPRDITCRRWLSQGQYSKKMAARTDAYTNKNSRHSTGSKMWDNYNPDYCVCGIIGLSEHWLYNSSLTFHDNIKSNYTSYALAVPDLELLSRRKVGKGGVAFLWKKSLYQYTRISPFVLNTDKIFGVHIILKPGV